MVNKISTRSFGAHIVLGVLLLVLGVSANAALGAIGHSNIFAIILAEFLVVVPISLFLVTRFHPLNLIGVILTAALVTTLAQLAIVAIYDHAAHPAGGHVFWSDFYAYGRGINYIFMSLVTVCSSILWFVAIRRGPSWVRPRSNVSGGLPE